MHARRVTSLNSSCFSTENSLVTKQEHPSLHNVTVNVFVYNRVFCEKRSEPEVKGALKNKQENTSSSNNGKSGGSMRTSKKGH